MCRKLFPISSVPCTKRTVLLKNLKFLLDTYPKLILLDYQNNYAGCSMAMLSDVKYFDILANSLHIKLLK